MCSRIVLRVLPVLSMVQAIAISAERRALCAVVFLFFIEVSKLYCGECSVAMCFLRDIAPLCC